MTTRHAVWTLAAAALLAAGCRSSRPRALAADGAPGSSGSLAGQMDRGDWLVDRRTTVWKVLEEQERALPLQRGFLARTQYRQARGGPPYDVYTVTTTNRRETVGRIDQVGRAWRYVPRRNAGFDEVDVGIGTLEDSVGAIFETRRRIILEPTTERRLAFEAIDANGDGRLGPEETAKLGDRIAGADRNGDGLVDFQEFDALDRL